MDRVVIAGMWFFHMFFLILVGMYCIGSDLGALGDSDSAQESLENHKENHVERSDPRFHRDLTRDDPWSHPLDLGSILKFWVTWFVVIL